jgi:hypothetical protein
MSWRGCVVLASGIGLIASLPSVARAQRGTPALPACAVPQADTSGWKEYASEIAPISFRAPADFANFAHDSSAHRYEVGARASKPLRWSEDWSGRTAPYVLVLLRTNYPRNAPPLRGVTSPQVRELTLCRAWIGGLAVEIFSDRRVRAKVVGADTLDLYEAGGTFALAENDSLSISSAGDDPATQALVLAIVRSVRARPTGPR